MAIPIRCASVLIVVGGCAPTLEIRLQSLSLEVSGGREKQPFARAKLAQRQYLLDIWIREGEVKIPELYYVKAHLISGLCIKILGELE